MATRITIGDAVFEPVPTAEASADNVGFMISELRKAGIASLDRYTGIANDDVRNVSLVADIYDSGHLFTLLAGLYRRAGEPWKRDQVEANASVFSEAKGVGVFATFLSAVGEALADFFVSGGSSSPTSPTASPQPTTTAAPRNTSAPRATTTANGTASSGTSPGPTPIASAPSRNGRSAKRSSRSASTSGANA
jgi:hypothetical protein